MTKKLRGWLTANKWIIYDLKSCISSCFILNMFLKYRVHVVLKYYVILSDCPNLLIQTLNNCVFSYFLAFPNIVSLI